MILPSEATAWSRDHLRLHRWLRREPGLLPVGAALLLAVSGGQDSMALTALLLGLRRRHGWRLHLWHGDHRWRPESGEQAAELAAWAGERGLDLRVEQAAEPPGGEAEARAWRYDCLAREAHRLDCRYVVTGHTASDRAETVLLNLARGSHRRGLTGPSSSRQLNRGLGSPALVRPLLPFTREDTGRICRELGLPVWIDASNDDPRHSRNRVRSEVLPVLEALHPGSARRISSLAERWGREIDAEEELLAQALEALTEPAPAPAHAALARRRLTALRPANQGRLLELWLQKHGRPMLSSHCLALLLTRLPPSRGPGRVALGQGWQLRWDSSTLVLISRESHG